MNRRVQIGILLFLTGGVFYTIWSNRPPPQVETPPPAVTRVEATTFIPEQVVITESMVRDVALTNVDVPIGGSLPAEWVLTSLDAVGHISRQEIPMGTRLERGMVGGLIVDEGLAALIPFGLRAMPVRIFRDGPQAIHDMVRTGDRIDLIASFGSSGFTKTIVENIPVLAVDVFVDDERSIAQRGDFAAPRGAAAAQRPQQAAPKKVSPTLTLGVTPEQVEIIALVDRAADIEFVVRGRHDTTRIYMARSGSRRGITLAEILPPEPIVRPAKKKRQKTPSLRAELPSWPIGSAKVRPSYFADGAPIGPSQTGPSALATEKAKAVSEVTSRRLNQEPAMPAPAEHSVEIFAPGSRRIIEVPTGSSNS